MSAATKAGVRVTRTRLGGDGTGGSGPPAWLGGVIGVAGLLIVWTVLASTVFGTGDGVPTPWAVLRQIGRDGIGFYRPLIQQTGGEALRGYLAGNGLALACAALVLLVPALERMVVQLAVASYCLPLVAIGPILSILLSGDAPMITMAALSVFFTTLVGALLGLRSAEPATLDLVRAYGGGRWQMLIRVRLFAALPSTLAALKIAAPAALLGAIIGEYLGHIDTGLGVAMINSEQQLDVARTWGIALMSGAVAGLGYGLTALAARVLLPWARNTTLDGGPV
jgi:ABC-type nitrate/sulfonate/bicarbonate transport system permease component